MMHSFCGYLGKKTINPSLDQVKIVAFRMYFLEGRFHKAAERISLQWKTKRIRLIENNMLGIVGSDREG